MIHAMIDLETLSTKPNATILTIGGVKFDPYTRVEPSQGLYHRIDVDSQVAMGRDVMEETVEWWGRQAEDVREEALGDHDRIDLKVFHQAVEQMVGGGGRVLVPGSVVRLRHTTKFLRTDECARAMELLADTRFEDAGQSCST
jgi:hypothetical protein